jgi:glutamate synthase (NADPH/NADH) large chain
MTGGSAIILGDIGDNFGAGMTGGCAFIYSEQKNISDLMNKETIGLYEVDNKDWKNHLLDHLKDFYKETKSKRAEFIIENYDSEIKKFAHVVPNEVIDKLEFPVTKKSKIA